jgi:hypothetical protein
MWKPVKDYEGLYEVSSDGQVRSLDRIDRLGRFREGRVIRQGYAGAGYSHINLRHDGQRKGAYVHRLVAEAFLDGDGEVNHINGDKADNRVENLEWSTHADNIKHALDSNLSRRDQLGRFAA